MFEGLSHVSEWHHEEDCLVEDLHATQRIGDEEHSQGDIPLLSVKAQVFESAEQFGVSCESKLSVLQRA